MASVEEEIITWTRREETLCEDREKVALYKAMRDA